MINHVTYQVAFPVLHHPDLDEFMSLLRLLPADPADDVLEQGYDVKWYKEEGNLIINPTVLHLVGALLGTPLNLGHFCVAGIGFAAYDKARTSEWVERDSGSGRCWLRFGLLRAEVRP